MTVACKGKLNVSLLSRAKYEVSLPPGATMSLIESPIVIVDARGLKDERETDRPDSAKVDEDVSLLSPAGELDAPKASMMVCSDDSCTWSLLEDDCSNSLADDSIVLCGEVGVTGLEILALVGTELVVSLADTSCRSVERSAVHILVVYVESVLTRISEKKIYM